MIWYIVTDSLENYERYIGAFGQHKLTLERLARDCCLMLHYTQVRASLLKQLRPWAICHSGGSAIYDTYDVLEHKAYGACITHCDSAQIGFCGGCQVLAMKLGSTAGPMRRLRADEADPNPNYMPGQIKEWGVYPVHVVQRDPLFAGLGQAFRVQEFHGWEVQTLGRDLTLLASSEHCRVQAFVQRQRLVYGVQFHPEQSPPDYPDGFTLLGNFFRLARRHARVHAHTYPSRARSLSAA
jgi:GMP synthase-like glutamine amidotransferase